MRSISLVLALYFGLLSLYPKVTGPSGASIAMGLPLGTGACNACHGVSTGKIGID
jgi:mono/diheme cytochrome c family protein